MTTNNITELAYEKIDETYSWAKYSDFNVIMMMTGEYKGYINATKLCTDGNKRYDNWFANKLNKQLIDCFTRLPGIPGSLTVSVVTGRNETRGTYVHKDLIVHIASWVSPEFAYKVSKIVNNHLVILHRLEITKKDETIYTQNILLKKRKMMLDENQDVITGQSVVIVEKEDSIVTLNLIIEELKEFRAESKKSISELLAKTQKLDSKISEDSKRRIIEIQKSRQESKSLKGGIKDLKKDNELANLDRMVIKRDLKFVKESLSNSIVDRVPDTQNERTLGEFVVVIRKYNINDMQTDDNRYNYHICRGQKIRASQALKRIKIINKNAEIIFSERSPNSVNAINRLKESKLTHFRRGSSNHCNITIPEEDFLDLLRDVVIQEKSNV